MAADATEYVDHPLLAPRALEARTYQTELAGVAADAHTLVCLPTGLGKTAVSALVTAERLHADAGGTALFLAPTKPLVEQHAADYREWFEVPDDDVVVFTGEVRPDDRADLFADARIVVATPQVVENDLVGNRISLRDVVHLTFDECHRATGDYAYTYIAERYHADAADPLVTGMSASPGDDEDAIRQVCRNLGIERVEVRTAEHDSVAPYTHDTSVEWKTVELPDAIQEIRDALNGVIEDRLESLADLGVNPPSGPDLSERDLQTLRRRLQSLIDDEDSAGYTGMSLHAELRKLKTAVTYVETQSVEAFRRYLERQHNAARASGASKATQRFVSDPGVKRALRLAQDYDDLHPKYRQARMLLAETLGIAGGDRVIVFTESRDTAEALTAFLGEHFETRKFVGQSDTEGSDGMTQTEQRETLEAFRAGEFSVLVSTSVAEEGLDVPEVDLVLFYEPVPTAIRSIQRKGRTGRQDEGRVVVLLAEDTRDEAYFWIAKRREEEMRDQLAELDSLAPELTADLGGPAGEQATVDGAAGGDPSAPGDGSAVVDDAVGNDGAGQQAAADGAGAAVDGDADTGEAGTGDDRPQAGLDAFAPDEGGDDAGDGDGDGDADRSGEGDGDAVVARAGEDPGDGDAGADAAAEATADAADDPVEVVVDQRELDSPIAKDLSTRGDVEVRLETLAVGDYVLSDRVAVERKSVADFLDSLLGGDDRSVFEQTGELVRYYDRPVVVLEGDGLFEERNVHPNAIRGALAALAVDFGASVLHTRDPEDTAGLLETVASREQTERDREVSAHGEKAAKTLAEQQEYVVSSVADVGPVTARSLLAEFGSVEAVMTADVDALQEAEGVGEITAERIREVVGSQYSP